MCSSPIDDVWGPVCRLVKELSALRAKTEGGPNGVGINKLYARISDQKSQRETQSTTALLTKLRIQGLLEGKGKLPGWEEVRTLVEAMQHYAGEKLDQDPDRAYKAKLQAIVTATHVPAPPPPCERDIAKHFAKRMLQWGQQNIVDYLTRDLDDPHRTSMSVSARRDIKQNKELLRANDRHPDEVIEGAVAIAHASPDIPLDYQKVFSRNLPAKLNDFQQWGPFRPNGGNANDRVEFLETGLRQLTAIYKYGSSIRVFVVIEALSVGSVSVYFRWIPLVSDKDHRLDRLLRGVISAIKACLYTHHLYLGASGTVNACIAFPGSTYDVSRIPLPSEELDRFEQFIVKHFNTPINQIAGLNKNDDYASTLLDGFK